MTRRNSTTTLALAVLSWATAPVQAHVEVGMVTALDAATGNIFGQKVAMSGDLLIVGSRDAAGDTGFAYVFARDAEAPEGWSQVKLLIPSDAASGHWFGNSVSIDGDVAVVGSFPANSPPATAAPGAAYIFARNHGGPDNWGEVAKLEASDGADFDGFGKSVALSGDTVLVTAWADDDAGWNSGSAYVFQRNQGGADNWGEVTKLIGSDGVDYRYFGGAVAISGSTAIVGASNAEHDGLRTGAVYVFDRDNGGTDNWGQVARMIASDAAAQSGFGVSVSILEDTVVVGAPGDDGGTGAAYVFARDVGGSDNWGEVTKLTASGPDDHFGLSVSMGRDLVLVGATEMGLIVDPGAAYLFARNHGGVDQWGEVSTILAGDATPHDGFGFSVAICGDEAVVGAALRDGIGPNSGAAYVLAQLLPACLAADLSDDAMVDVTDVLQVLAAWGTPAGDVNGDGTTDVSDLLQVLAVWGACG